MNTIYIDRQLAPYGVFLLRVALGVMWIAHASLKWFVFTIPGFAIWLDSQGLPASMAWPVFLLELVGGLAIALGLYGRYVSLALVPVMAVAMSTHFGNGWLFVNQGGGWEYPVFLVAASVAHGLLGDGAFAVRSQASLLRERAPA
jgi:putative oxidoreductase